MALYNLSKDRLSEVKSKKIDLEKNIQQLTEKNLDIIFGLTFVSGSLNKEFSVKVQEQDFYIDTLAFDEEQQSIVIIEYKKDRSFSVIDQGFAYLSAMLNRKADFILELNEKLDKNFRLKDINWEQSRIIFVSPEFTNYQRNAINFKDLPIYLYEVNIYENNLVEYDPIKPYRTTESIGNISQDKTIQQVSREVKTYTFEDHLERVDPDLKELFTKLHHELLNIGEGIKENVTKHYIGFRFHGTNYTAISPRKGKVLINFRMKEEPASSLKIEQIPSTAWDTTPLWKTEVKSEDQIPEVLKIARHSYQDYANRYK